MKRIKLTLLASLCCLLWGSAAPVLKLMYKALEIPADDMYSKFILAGFRFLGSGIFIGIFILIRDGKIIKPKASHWKYILIFGLLNTSIQYMFYFVGVGNTPAIKVVLIDIAKPLMVVVLAHFFTQDDKLTLWKVLGLLVGFIGIMIANMNQLDGGAMSLHMTITGEGFLLISSLAYSVAMIYGRSAMKVIPSTRLNMYQMIFGSLLLLVLGLVGSGGYHLDFNLTALLLLAYSSLLAAVAFVLWYYLIDNYQPSSVAMHFFLVPVFGSIFSSIIFPEEHLGSMAIISLILLSISIYLVNRPKVPSGHRAHRGRF